MYQVLVADRGGPLREREVEGFADALELAKRWHAELPKKAVRVSNLDRCDVDSDGLTDEELDAVIEATW